MSLCCPISVKFCTRDRYLLLLTDSDVKTATGKVVLLLMDIHTVTGTRVP